VRHPQLCWSGTPTNGVLALFCNIRNATAMLFATPANKGHPRVVSLDARSPPFLGEGVAWVVRGATSLRHQTAYVAFYHMHDDGKADLVVCRDDNLVATATDQTREPFDILFDQADGLRGVIVRKGIDPAVSPQTPFVIGSPSGSLSVAVHPDDPTVAVIADAEFAPFSDSTKRLAVFVSQTTDGGLSWKLILRMDDAFRPSVSVSPEGDITLLVQIMSGFQGAPSNSAKWTTRVVLIPNDASLLPVEADVHDRQCPAG
jgi:hypothetical protein